MPKPRIHHKKPRLKIHKGHFRAWFVTLPISAVFFLFGVNYLGMMIQALDTYSPGNTDIFGAIFGTIGAMSATIAVYVMFWLIFTVIGIILLIVSIVLIVKKK
jgi:hypothetical protein